MNICQHPLDGFISFDENTHTYTLYNEDGSGSSEGVVSVTTFLHEFFEKFDADKVIEKMMKNVTKFNSGPYVNMTALEIKELWNKNCEEASLLGTKMHKSIETFYKTGEIPETIPKEFEMFQTFHKNNSHLEPYRSEWSIYIKDLKLAGQLDMLYRTTTKDKETFVLCDWKRCKSIEKTNRFRNGKDPLGHLPDCNFTHYSLQLNLYKYILEKYYGLNVGEMYLIALHPTQENYLQFEVPVLQDEIEKLLQARLEYLNKIGK